MATRRPENQGSNMDKKAGGQNSQSGHRVLLSGPRIRSTAIKNQASWGCEFRRKFKKIPREKQWTSGHSEEAIRQDGESLNMHLVLQLLLTLSLFLLYKECLATVSWSRTVNQGTYRPRIHRRRDRRSALFPNTRFTSVPIPPRKTCPCSTGPCHNFGECQNVREDVGASYELDFNCTCVNEWHGEICNICNTDRKRLCDQNRCLAARPMGMEDGSIKNRQITASDYNQLNPNWAPQFGRLNKPNGYLWLSNINDPNPWIQVDMIFSTIIIGIITQGGCVVDSCLFGGWINNVHIKTGDKVGSLSYILENGSPKSFPANIDAISPNDQADVLFPERVETRYVRIYPLFPYNSAGGLSSPGMRFEILGCEM